MRLCSLKICSPNLSGIRLPRISLILKPQPGEGGGNLDIFLGNFYSTFFTFIVPSEIYAFNTTTTPMVCIARINYIRPADGCVGVLIGLFVEFEMTKCRRRVARAWAQSTCVREERRRR